MIFQLPLSGSPELPERIHVPEFHSLSTPSLGITINRKGGIARTFDSLLSTPSLGITKELVLCGNSFLLPDFQLPLSGSHVNVDELRDPVLSTPSLGITKTFRP